MALTAASAAMHHHLQRRKHPRSSYTASSPSSSGTSSPPPPSLLYYVSSPPTTPSTSRISSFVPSTVILHNHAPMTTTSTASSSSSLPHSAAQNPDLRKRQRRQAAGNLVSGLFGNAASGGSGREGSFTGGTGSGNGAPSSAVSLPTGIGGGGGKAPGTTGAGRKSTAQPRPSIHIPPRGIGPVYNPNSNDVLCGRGGRINAHSGNVQFRDLVQSRKFDYLSEKTKKLEKAHIASSIVRQIREMQPPGRFLKEDPDGSWFDIGDAKAIKKVGQALREDAPDIRGDAPAGSDDDEPNGTAPIMTVVPLPPPVSSPPVVVSAGTTVSARGGRVPSHGTGRGAGGAGAGAGGDPYLVPSGPAGAGGGNFSGAAAAAVQDAEFMPAPLARDMAFGCQFHMTDPGKDGSMISGLSFVPSGVSGVSALTDPSVLGGTPSSMRGAAISNSLRVSQLKHLRQQWAAQQQQQHNHNQHGNSLQSDGTATRMLLSSQNGLGNSLQASSNFMGSGRQPRAHSLQDAQSVSDAMSWAEHSLVGGGIAGTNAAVRPHHQYSDNASVGNVSHMQPSVSGQQSLFGANMSVGSYSMTSKDDSWIGGGRYSHQPLPLQQPQQPQPPMYPSAGEDRSSSNGGASSASRTTAAHYNTYYGGGGGGNNGGDRSVHSGGEESVSMQSILSNLSENLIALDLAGTHGTSLLDQL